jgi:serine/threonine-protein kinase
MEEPRDPEPTSFELAAAGTGQPPPDEAVTPDLTPLPLSETITFSFPGMPAPAAGETTEPGGHSDQPTPPPVDRAAVPGYELLSVLGRGGMGVVYKARQVKLNRLVALKMILGGAHADAQTLARFRSEAEAVARLQHPGIVQIYEVGEHQGLPFFSLEFCAGGSLAGRLTGAPLPARQAAQAVETVARAVQAAHQRGIIHRDLKPANVLLTADGRLKVTDFGLAKRFQGEPGASATGGPPVADAPGSPSDPLTQTGAILGTPSYMAPEQAWGKSRIRTVGPAADVYALGAILYELLTGRPPFRAETPLDTLQLVMTEEPVPVRRLQPKVPRDLETICLKCLQKDPAKRYAVAADLAADLARFQRGEPIIARPVGRVERLARWARRRPALAALAGLAVASFVVVVGLVIALWSQNEDLARANDQLTREKAATETQRQRAEANYRKALDAVNRSLRRLGEQRLAHVPEMDEVREEFLLDALQFYQGFLKDQGNPDPEVRRETAVAALQVGIIQRLLRRSEPAERHLRQALAAFERLRAEFPHNPTYRDDMAACHDNLGLFDYGLSRVKQAEAHFRKAQVLWEDLVRAYPDDGGYGSRYADCLNTLANLYSATGHKARAETLHQRVLDLWTRLVARYPRNDAFQGALAMSRHNLAVLYLGANRLPEARALLLQARTTFERSARALPRNADGQERLATCLTSLGVLNSSERQPAEAEKCHRQALAIRTRLVHDHPRAPDWQHHLAVSYHHLGNLHWTAGRAALAEAPYQKAVELCRQLVEEYPRVDDYRQTLAEDQLHLAMVYETTNRTSEARLAYDQAREAMEPLARDHPQLPHWATSLGKVYFHLGHLAQKQGDKKAAIKWCTRSIDTLNPIVRKDRGNKLALMSLQGAYALRAMLYQSSGRNLEALSDLWRWNALKKPAPRKAKAKR